MSVEDKNKLLDEYINDLINEVDKQYKGLIDKDKARELYDKYKDSDKDLKEDIIPEIEDTVNKLIDEFLKLKSDLESMMEQKMQQESEKILSLNNSEKVLSNTDMINCMVIGQLETKEEFKKYISDVCSKNPALNSQDMMDKFDSIISDEQIEEMRETLMQQYKAKLESKYGKVELGSPEEIRNKLAAMGVDINSINEFVEKVAKGENIEAIAQLTEKYGEEVVQKLTEETNEVGYDKIKQEVYTKKLLNPYYKNGIGYIALLVAIVSFGIGALSTMTYFIISSMFK